MWTLDGGSLEVVLQKVRPGLWWSWVVASNTTPGAESGFGAQKAQDWHRMGEVDVSALLAEEARLVGLPFFCNYLLGC